MDLLTANDTPGRYPGSYYAAFAPEMRPYPAATGALTCDVCIVGGGYTGLSAALHLAERGYDVVLLEAQRVGFGASGRNGGQVGTGQRRDQDELERMVGPDRAHQLWDIATEAVHMVRQFCAAPDMDCAFREGVVHADHRARYVPHSRAYAEKLARNYGHDQIEFLDRDAIRALVKSKAYFGGTIDRLAGHVEPLRYALGLARKAQAAGARLFERSRVLTVEKGPKCRISTGDATIEADHVILACNGYLGGLEPEVAARVMPINNFIIATEPLSTERRRAILTQDVAVADSKFVVNYFRFSPDGRLLFGGSESYGYRFPRDIIAKVRRPMLQIFPQLKDTRIEYAWGGTLGITMTRLPHFTRLSGNVLSLSGYSGHGVAMATMGGRLAAEAIAGQAERFDVMASLPVPRFPGGAALRWPLLVLAMVWYQLRDRL